jgi:hypothetical protein
MNSSIQTISPRAGDDPAKAGHKCNSFCYKAHISLL